MSPNIVLASETELQNLTVTGMALMVGCIALVLTLCIFCFWRLTHATHTAEHHHAPLDIDTRDMDG